MSVGRDPAVETGGLDAVRILLVDDDERWAWVTRRLLERVEPFTVETAHSLDAGWDRFDELDPDCVICDYRLGDGNGLELLEAVRQVDSTRPFVLVTGESEDAIESDSLDDVTDHVYKADDDGTLLAGLVANAVQAYRDDHPN